MPLEPFKPTQYTETLAIELAQMFGGQDEVPNELKTAWYMTHARLMEAEQDVAYFWERVARYRADAPAPSPTGPETGEF